MAHSNISGSSSYSLLERFLIWFVIPFVFTAVLLGVLLSIFDYDIKSSVQKALHNSTFDWDSRTCSERENNCYNSGEDAVIYQQLKSKDHQIAQLNSKVTELESALQKADQVTQRKIKV